MVSKAARPFLMEENGTPNATFPLARKPVVATVEAVNNYSG
jgi:hypothetical protein